MTSDIIMRVENLTKKFGVLVAVNNVSFEISEGKIFGLLGPNGAGKTTIVRMIATLTTPTSGNVIFKNMDIKENKLEIRRHLGIVPQEPAVYDNLTVKENLEYAGKMYDVPANELEERTENLLSLFDLKEKKDTLVKKLSGGMKRKLNFSLAMIHRPDLVILDEPTVGLDPSARKSAWEMITKLKEMHVAVLMTTHYMDEADYLCDYVLMIDEGRIKVEGTPKMLKRSFGKEIILSFVVDSNAAKKITEDIKREELASKIYFDGKSLKLICNSENKPKIIKRITDLDIAFSGMSVIEPTLEDVFMKFTGKRLVEESNLEFPIQ